MRLAGYVSILGKDSTGHFVPVPTAPLPFAAVTARWTGFRSSLVAVIGIRPRPTLIVRIRRRARRFVALRIVLPGNAGAIDINDLAFDTGPCPLQLSRSRRTAKTAERSRTESALGRSRMEVLSRVGATNLTVTPARENGHMDWRFIDGRLRGLTCVRLDRRLSSGRLTTRSSSRRSTRLASPSTAAPASPCRMPSAGRSAEVEWSAAAAGSTPPARSRDRRFGG